ncbi:hypothetical protein GGQ22_13685 [Nocardioides sp. zg-579]|uniref:Uncharacterized protein n=1 Tax=Nocardioides marmotae TaxID=2663857 RepID=A0A6I3JDF0_9ACTN|nr:hypothetical protein [Nocardioides marmotae]MCR6032482.1 hypothetical protein [Gordonia jinghuaiqii]MTB96131.1 hypothetical protein [Nocardioides marmotae]QKD99792.1 hypothetical protein HPC71_00790 [Nocardioides marmotae]
MNEPVNEPVDEHPLGDPQDEPTVPRDAVEAADLADSYDRMSRLADLFDAAGEEARARAALGAQVLGDPAVAESAELAPATWAEVERDVLAATGEKHGLLGRSAELDADAVVVRATVATYRWIDELAAEASRTLGAIAGRAIGYLAPEVALGGPVLSAGLIELDTLDREDVASYLSELAQDNPELLEHVSGGGGLLDGLRMRSLLTVGLLAGETGRAAARGGLRAVGAEDLAIDVGSALRDVAGGVVDAPGEAEDAAAPAAGGAPRGLAGLMSALGEVTASVAVTKVGEGRYIAYLPGPSGGGARLRLVSGDAAPYAAQVVRSIEAAVEGDDDARVMLVGSAQGGVTAAEVAAAAGGPSGSASFTVEQVVTAGAPAAQVARVPEPTRVLALEDRADPVALLGSLLNLAMPNRLTVVFEAAAVDGSRESTYVAGGRAADAADHPAVRTELDRLASLGYLAG